MMMMDYLRPYHAYLYILYILSERENERESKIGIQCANQ